MRKYWLPQPRHDDLADFAWNEVSIPDTVRALNTPLTELSAEEAYARGFRDGKYHAEMSALRDRESLIRLFSSKLPADVSAHMLLNVLDEIFSDRDG